MKKVLVLAILGLFLSHVSAFACGMKDHAEGTEGSENTAQEAAK